MNILYIGPYRLNTSAGYESLSLLLNLQEQYKNIVSRPIYNEQPINKLKDIDYILSGLEDKKNIKHFDLVIQHTTPESMVYTSKIPKSIFIPILQNKLNNDHQKQILSFLETKGLFVITTNIDEYIMEDSEIKNRHLIKTVINNRLIKQSNGTFNFGLYKTYQKYYTITHSSCERNIKNFIINFIKNNHKDDSCFVIFMSSVTHTVLDDYNSFIKQIYKQLGVKFGINKIIIIPIEIDNYTISTIHSCCDIYIDINYDINKYYAMMYNKPVIHNTSALTIFDDYMNLNSFRSVSYKDPINLDSIQPIISPSLTLNDIVEKYV